jgi:predicted Ser/Thr protein kinase
MDAQQWARVREILHEALGRAPESRAVYLDEACRGDATCRAEVESLLAAAQQSAFLDSPALASGPATAQMPAIDPSRPLGPYKVIEKIGEGGMGMVYKALDTRLDRLVALKVLPAARAWVQEKRFAREAKAASALNHPNIVTIYEFDRQEGVDYIAMEYVQGTPLDRLLFGGPLPLQRSLEYARQIAGALAKAHAAGIVHRDLKPGNIMITPEDQVKVLDFGLAKRAHAAGDPDATLTQALTQAGNTVGTPAYMSPEQVMGEQEDARSDIFSFGVILYELVCGRRPFEAGSSHATMYRIAHEEPPAVPAVNPDAPPALAALIAKCLKKDRAQRPQSMAEVEAALAALTSITAANSSTRRAWVGVAVALALLGGGGVWYASRPASPPPASLAYSIEAQKVRGDQPLGAAYTASVSDTFEGGWRFRLHLRPAQTGFLYLITEGPNAGGANRLWVLYPRLSGSASVRANQDVQTEWYDFDANPGVEKLWIVWSAQPLQQIQDGLLQSRQGRVESLDASHAIERLVAGLGRSRREPAADGWMRVSAGGAGKTVAEKLELNHY